MIKACMMLQSRRVVGFVFESFYFVFILFHFSAGVFFFEADPKIAILGNWESMSCGERADVQRAKSLAVENLGDVYRKTPRSFPDIPPSI